MSLGETVMLKSVENVIKRIFEITDILGGICFFSVMALVLANIIMRNVFSRPILGTVEIVGLLVATGLGLALAHCEMVDGHIGMDLSMDKFLSQGSQKVMETVSYLISLSFWAIVVWRLLVFAITTFVNGRVTSTASIPIYPFIFILGFNVFCLCVALGYKLVRSAKEASAIIRKSARERTEGSM